MQTYQIQPDWIQGAISIETLPEGLKPWRIHHFRRELFATPNDILLDKAEGNAGIRLRFWTDSPTLRVALKDEGKGSFDLVCNNEIVSTHSKNAETLVLNLSKPDTYEIWFSPTSKVILREIMIEDGCTLKTSPDTRKRWITWGSSITQCNESHSPARTWPATAARKLDLNLTCLGFGGNCHMESLVAKIIRDFPADLITLKLGINVYGRGSLHPRTFEIAALGIIDLIREKHPHTPIGLISPIISPDREEKLNSAEINLVMMREHLKDAHRRLENMNDHRITYTSGLDLFGKEETHMLPDDLHPNGDGYEFLGNQVASKVLEPLLEMLKG